MLMLFFVRVLAIGSLTFGGGYAMISALQQDLVARHGWLSAEEFSNGVAVGQVTPGPLMVMIAFMGYKMAGLWGAVLGTLALFLPSACMVVILGRYYGKARANRVITAALKGVNAAVVGLLAAASVSLGRGVITSPYAVAIGLFSMLLAGLWRLEPAWVLIGAGAAGAWLLR